MIKYFCLAFISFNLLWCAVHYVHPDSTLNSIQTALDLCNAHDTVLVGPGIYHENIIWTLTSGIDLVSEKGTDSTVIDGGGSNSVIWFDGYSSTAGDSGTVIRGFTIRNGYAGSEGGGGLHVFKASPQIIDNRITENSAYWRGGGIYFYGTASVVTGNVIDNNYTPRFGGGMFVSYAVNINVRNNTFDSNTADSLGGGVFLDYWDGNFLFNTICNNNAGDFGGGIYVSNADWSVNCNNIFGNSNYGLYNADTAALEDAVYNWWGHESGPYHPLQNPGGQGDWVSDHVDFDPWLTEPFGVAESDQVSAKGITFVSITPNPFRATTRIAYQMTRSGIVAIAVYNAAGSETEKLFDGAQSAGKHSITWNASRLPQGIYFVRIKAGREFQTKKMVLTR